MQMAAVTGSGRASGLDSATIHFSGRRVAGARLVDGSRLQGIHTYPSQDMVGCVLHRRSADLGFLWV